MACFPYITVLTTAPTWRQVEKILWRYIHAQCATAKIDLGGNLLKTEWNIGEDRMALGLSTNDPDKFQGFHQKRVLVVVDEASGVEDAIFDAIDGVTVGPLDVIFLIGNPTNPECQFAKYLTGKKRATVLNVSSWEAAEAREKYGIQGLASKEWCQAKLEEWGEDSAAYISRVLGQLPNEREDALIRYAWVNDAMEREPTYEKIDDVVCGIDVARYGSDKTVWVFRKGNDVIGYEELEKGSIPEQVALTAQYAVEYRVKHFNVDDTGIGGGLTDYLAHEGFSVSAFNFGAAAQEDQKYENVRAELWWNMREWFRLGTGAVLDNDDVRGDCVAPRYFFSKAKQRIQLEPKDQIKKRRGRSTDFGDALALALWDSLGVQPFGVDSTEEAIDFWDQGWGKTHQGHSGTV